MVDRKENVIFIYLIKVVFVLIHIVSCLYKKELLNLINYLSITKNNFFKEKNIKEFQNQFKF